MSAFASQKTIVRRLSLAISAAALLVLTSSSGCILGNDGRPLGAGTMDPLLAGGCASEPGCGANSCGPSCCSEVGGPSCSDGNGYCDSGNGPGRCGNGSLCYYACMPFRAAGKCVGGVFNFCLPPACISGPPPLPPGRFFPVPTRPAFCPRDSAGGPPCGAM